MPLNKTKFKAVASKLFTQARNGGLTINCTFELLGDYSPSTGQAASVSQAIECIREDYTEYQTDGVNVQRDDFKLLAEVDSFTLLSPRTDGVKVNVNGVSCVIKHVDTDTADAVHTIQVRGS